MKTSILFCVVCCAALTLSATPRADREARVDAAGVLRWTDDQSEIALVGVNYYPPFTVDFKALTKRGLDLRQVMRQDVAHFRRLGLGVVRIHCFDREFSRADGSFVDNVHVELLDYLIDLCAENGIYMVLTPIAWWGGHYAPGDVDGFSNHFDMNQMTADRCSWPVQARFLREFASHVNRFTKKRYADDPAILAFECINEPLYPKDHPDAEVTAYVNTLVDALRAAGTRKPIYYNSWQNRNAAVGASRADGVTGSYYPTGLVAGRALVGPQLGRIRASTLRPDDSIARKSRMIYEFDAADAPGSYMYPALGKLFRHEGVQVAAMFQYDPLPVANVNTGWKTHHLNLVYTPAKAISIAIMAETFRHLPRACDYVPCGDRIVFPPFRVDALRDLSEYVVDDAYCYTSDPVTPPKNPATLCRVWGCGKSSVAASSGTGAYFLDRVASGVWRLQLYPDVFTVADPYTGKPCVKEVLLATTPAFAVNLPDLGANWVATPLHAPAVCDRTTFVKVADCLPPGQLLAPGDYLLTAAAPTREQLTAARAFDLPPFVAPAPERPTTRISAHVPPQDVANQPIPITCHSVFAEKLTAKLVRTSDGHTRTLELSSPSNNAPFTVTLPALAAGDWRVSLSAQGPGGNATLPESRLRICSSRADWEFFDAQTALEHGVHGGGLRNWTKAVRDDHGHAAFHLHVDGFTERRSSVSFLHATEPEAYRRRFPKAGPGRALVLRARAALPRTDKLEVVLMQTNGQSWGTTISLTDQWRDVRIPFASLRYMKHWGLPDISDADKPDIRLTQAFSFCFGTWLFPSSSDKPHAFEISSIRVED